MRYTNNAIAEAFANGATEGQSNSGSLFIVGDVIYSYGYHWPLAMRVGFNEMLVNGDKYSMRTSQHTGAVAGRAACKGFNVTRVSKRELEERIEQAKEAKKIYSLYEETGDERLRSLM